MTTGRINQVAIVTAQVVSGEPSCRGLPKGRPESLRGQGGRPGPTARSGKTSGAKAAGDPSDHPIAPTESPKKRSAADVGMRDAERRPTL